jgi:hypothetical protein
LGIVNVAITPKIAREINNSARVKPDDLPLNNMDQKPPK